ncbi:MAG: O-antigen ligase family protein [bacterium]
MSTLDRSLTTRLVGRPSRETAAAWAGRWTRTVAIAMTVAVPVMVNPWGNPDAYIIPKVAVLLSLTAALVIGWGISWLLAREPRWRLTVPEIPLWAYLLFVLLSSSLSFSPLQTFFGIEWRYEGLLVIFTYALLFFVGVHFFGSSSGFRALITAASIAALVVIAFGLLQLFRPPLFGGEAQMRLWYETIGAPRIGSLIGSPVEFGGYLCVVTPLLLALGLAGTGRGRFVWLGGATLGVAALMMTLTRAAWLGIAAGAAVFAVAAGAAPLRRHRLELVAMAAALAVILTGLVMAFVTPQRMAHRATSAVAMGSGSGGQRVYIWQGTAALIRQRPILGWGPETLALVFPYDVSSQVKHFGLGAIIIDRAHNDVLQVAVSNGILGAAAYVVFWALVTLAAVRVWRRATGSTRIIAAGWLAALFGYLVQVQFSFSAVSYTPLVWLLAGSAAGSESEGREN